QDARLPVFLTSRGDLLLLLVIFDDPNLGAVAARRIADDDHLEDRVIGREIDLVVQPANERTKLLEEHGADELEIRLGFPRHSIFARLRAHTLIIAVQADALGSG